MPSHRSPPSPSCCPGLLGLARVLVLPCLLQGTCTLHTLPRRTNQAGRGAMCNAARPRLTSAEPLPDAHVSAAGNVMHGRAHARIDTKRVPLLAYRRSQQQPRALVPWYPISCPTFMLPACRTSRRSCSLRPHLTALPRE
ncbi:hypothetical protein F5X68DRAFT_196809 [Plectosphaerella plurivora]|uniref:Secreted protein n=1 Tax=Plectosphaerella plurivora TaxID=936078 RepID=A0A9P9AI87_9PEZI|nr:hypothetical protein F5X68DRAFT_196809 [Plectosphaerella plurivora]